MNVQHWLDTPTICIEFAHGFGTELLAATEDRKPEFQLMPRYLKNGCGNECVVSFNLTFENGRMLPNWEELQFFPRGSQAPPSLSSNRLPRWSSQHGARYLDTLDELITSLYAADTQIERLEARIPLFMNRCEESKRQMTIDRVRMVYLKDAVERDNWPNKHLVLIVFSWADGFKVMQNGLGSGPPR